MSKTRGVSLASVEVQQMHPHHDAKRLPNHHHEAAIMTSPQPRSARRPCSSMCGRYVDAPATKCSNCQRPTASQRGLGSRWRKQSKQAVAAHVDVNGWWCPGWGVPAHESTDLTGDHHRPRAAGGGNEEENIGVLCRACNSRKKDHRAGPPR